MDRLFNAIRTGLAALLLAAFFHTVFAAPAQHVTRLQPIKDNTLFEHPDGALSSGAGVSIFTGRNNMLLARRALIAFAVPLHIPADAIITSATLQLHLSQ